jgi:hypothetical protein
MDCLRNVCCAADDRFRSPTIKNTACKLRVAVFLAVALDMERTHMTSTCKYLATVCFS